MMKEIHFVVQSKELKSSEQCDTALRVGRTLVLAPYSVRQVATQRTRLQHSAPGCNTAHQVAAQHAAQHAAWCVQRATCSTLCATLQHANLHGADSVVHTAGRTAY
jgi:hypothetical protein